MQEKGWLAGGPLLRVATIRRTPNTFLFISHTTNVLLFKFRWNIFIGVRIVKEKQGFGSEWDTLYLLVEGICTENNIQLTPLFVHFTAFMLASKDSYCILYSTAIPPVQPLTFWQRSFTFNPYPANVENMVTS